MGKIEPLDLKPRLRGVFHQWTFFVALVAGIVLVMAAPTGRAMVAASVYAGSVVCLFGVSALYHRITWASAAARRWMRRLDHSMIFCLIAGTYTPFALLVLEGTFATVLLVSVWCGALAGVVLNLVWIDAPRWMTAIVYLALGWVAIVALPDMVAEMGALATGLLFAGGGLYTLGAVIYALQRPDPAPAVFGYHEIFHLLVIAAAALQYGVAFYVVSDAA